MNTHQQPSIKKWFEANYLDGDKIQDGQMLSSKECFDALTSHSEAILERVEKILEDNRKETLWGDEDSNEIMKVSIDEFIKAVKADLALLNDSE